MSLTADAAGKPKLVLLIHGIRTHAWWQTRVASILTEEAECTVIPIKYGYFDVFRFLLPFHTLREGPIRRLLKELDTVAEQYPQHDTFAIAHSYGTYALARVMLENQRVKFRGIILCGSVLPKNFEWHKLHGQILSAGAKREAIVNECGTTDIWPVLAQSVTWGYGASGTDGFGSATVRDRFHPGGHGQYFDEGFVRQNWLPILRGSRVAFSSQDRKGVPAPWWFDALRLPYRFLFASLAAVLVLASVWALVVHMRPSEVILMDSQAIKYHPDTPGSNARQIRTILADFRPPIQTSYEAVYTGFDADNVIQQRNPKLIIIHLSAFYDESKGADIDEEELFRSDKEFRSFISFICTKTQAKALIYTRGLNGTEKLPAEVRNLLRVGYSRQLEFLRSAPIRNCATLFEIQSPVLFRDGAVVREFRERVSLLLNG